MVSSVNKQSSNGRQRLSSLRSATPSLSFASLEAPSWLVSLCIHVSIFLVLALAMRPYLRGTGGVAQTIGIAFVAEVAEGNENGAAQGGASDASSGGDSQLQKTILSAQAAVGQGPPLDVTTLLTDVQGSGSQNAPSAEALGGSGSALGAGSGSGSKGGKKKGQLTEVNFYDLQGSGNSFVFVIDRSDSMNEFSSAPLRAAKREVMKSLEGMKPTNFFQIIFYNDQPFPFQSKISGARSMIRSQDLEKRLAIDFVKNVNAFGGTEHLPALKMGIAMQPDVLFFLTDAEQPSLSRSDLDVLISKCEGITTIYSIEFGHGPNPAQGRWIEALALLSGGQYRYIDVTQLER